MSARLQINNIMQLLRFQQFIKENDSNRLGDLDKMRDLGIISPEEHEHERRAIKKELNVSSPQYKSELEKFNAVLQSEGAKKLLAKGLHLVSSKAQLAHGTLVFSMDPKYTAYDGWGIGFFGGAKTIKRMTPKGINVGVWRRDKGSMDIAIKSFPGEMTDLEFYDRSMNWAADNIDFEEVMNKPGAKDWKYYTKKYNNRSPEE